MWKDRGRCSQNSSLPVLKYYLLPKFILPDSSTKLIYYYNIIKSVTLCWYLAYFFFLFLEGESWRYIPIYSPKYIPCLKDMSKGLFYLLTISNNWHY